MDENKGLSYFLLGVGIGVAVGILFAPKSGEETRGAIKQKAGEGKDYLVQKAGESKEYLAQKAGESKEYLAQQTQTIRDKGSDLLNQGKQALQQQKDQLAAAVDAGKQAYRETVGGPYDRPAGQENNY